MDYKINIEQFVKDGNDMNIDITNVEILKIIDLLKQHIVNTENNYKKLEYVLVETGFQNPDYVVNEHLINQLELEEELRNNILKEIKLPLVILE